ncbi:MAG: excinuclease ABC subunit UvrC [Nitriliruptoraceae bacterium]
MPSMLVPVANPAARFRPEAGSIPDAPGCYLFSDHADRVVYVGKAKSLRSRLNSYFASWDGIAPKTRAMLSVATQVNWMVVSTESEALHLEYNLIQQHRPRYNIQFRDDKSFPYLLVSTSERVPRVRISRTSGKRYDRKFGPYVHAQAIRDTLDLVLRVFPVRTCSNGVYQQAERNQRACLLHHIGKCAAPCIGAVSDSEHRELIDGLANFLNGDTRHVTHALKQAMAQASADQRYETAAKLRDQLNAAEHALTKQQIISNSTRPFDVVAAFGDELDTAFQLLIVRNGRLVGQHAAIIANIESHDIATLLTRYLLNVYAEREHDIPATIYVPELPDDADALIALLAQQRRDVTSQTRAAVQIHTPQRGDKRALIALAETNAREFFTRSRLKRTNDFDARSRALRSLQDALGMAEAPLRIECFDISHLGGEGVVASMVVFEDGLPKRSEYRKFKLSHDQNDDYQAMREVLRRRFMRLQNHTDTKQVLGTVSDSFAQRPNLVLIDGGSGQLNAAREGAAELGVSEIMFVGLAKRFEELWLEKRKQPVVLARDSEARYLVQRVRDEAHRFAITYQRTTRTAAITQSALDGIPGVGPKRRAALLKQFGSVHAVKNATVAELSAVSGVSSTLATTILTELSGTTSKRTTDG